MGCVAPVLSAFPPQIAAHVGFRVEPAFVVDMVGSVIGFQPLDLFLEIVGQRVVGLAHMRP